MISENHSRALQVEQEQRIQIPREKVKIDSPNTIEIGTSSFNDRVTKLENSYQQSPRSEETQKAKSETTTTQISNSGLFLILTRKFNNEKLKKLCSEYGIAYNKIDGQTVQETASNLINYLKDKGELAEIYNYLTDYLVRLRPKGITIVAILNIISGILMLLFAIGLIAIGIISPMLPSFILNQSQLQESLTAGQSSTPSEVTTVPQSLLLGELSITFGGVLLAIAIASFIVAYGLLKGKGWSWTITVILSIIGMVWNAVTLITATNFGGIISIIINAIILYYLYRPHVKAYFGKGVSPSPLAA